MSTEFADRLDPQRGARPLVARVRDAVAQLVTGGSLLVDTPADAPSAVVIATESRRVAVVDAAAFASGTRWIEDTIARAVTGDLALIVVGALPDAVQPLLSRGVYDAVDETAEAPRLALSIRNALEMLELKERAENRSRWLRRFRNEAATLIDTARALSQERDTTKLLQMILEKCRYIAGADAGSIYVVEGTDPDIEKRLLRFKLSQNESVSFPTGEFVMPVSMRSIAGAAAIRRAITQLDDVYNLPPGSPFAFDRSFDARVGYRTKSVLTVPLVSAEDDVIGIVQLINKKRDPRVRLKTPGDVEREVMAFDDRSIEMVASLAAQAGIALENAMLYEEIRRIFEGFVRASVQAIEQRDPTTSGHSLRVSVLSCRLADAVDRTDTGPFKDARFSPQDLRELEYASLLHDFGKIGVREQVLVKPKKLYDGELRLIRGRFDYLHKALEAEIATRRAELYARNAPVADLELLAVEHARRQGEIEGYWSLIRESNEPTVMSQGTSERIDDIAKRVYTDPRGAMQAWLSDEEIKSLKIERGTLTAAELTEIRMHVSHTYDFLKRIPWGKSFARVPAIAGCHHERPNGRGYPRGLTGDEIPLGARVMAVADIFDALTASDRPYKKAVPLDRALAILNLEVRDGGLDPELVRIFVDAGVYRAIDEPLSY